MGAIHQALLGQRKFAGSGGGDDSGPELISGLQLWLNANAIVGASNDDQITTWADQSGNSRDATGVVVNTLKPTYRISDGPNSKPCIRMVSSATGQGGYFTLPDFLTSFSAGNVFSVILLDNEPPSASNHAAPAVGDFGSAGDEYYSFPSDGLIYHAFGSTARKNAIDPDATTAVSLTSWNIEEVQSASSSWIYKLNGVEKRNTGTNTVGWSTAPKIARSATNSKFAHMLLAEVILYNKILDSTERGSVHSYLNTKYGFTL